MDLYLQNPYDWNRLPINFGSVTLNFEVFTYKRYKKAMGLAHPTSFLCFKNMNKYLNSICAKHTCKKNPNIAL